jgi:hypothetical protein
VHALRRYAPAAAVAAALIGGVAASGCAAGAQGGADERTVAVPWVLLEAGPSARSIVVRASTPACAVGKARAVVSAKRSVVHVRLLQGTRGTTCTAEARTVTVVVALSEPLRGRRVVGAVRARGQVPYLVRREHGRSVALVPRVVGLQGDQAMRLLAREGLSARLVGSGARAVVRQDPARGRPAPAGVTLSTRS